MHNLIHIFNSKFIQKTLHKKNILATLFYLQISFICESFAQKEDADQRGLLPELQVKEGQSEETSEKKSLTSEILITRAENKAIEALKTLIKKKTGTAEEPDLLYRLAELYMRRSKSGRYFDLRVNQKNSTLTSLPIPNEKGNDSIRKAIEIYNQIETKFKKYPDMDAVLFNNAFAHQQLKLERVSENLYIKLLNDFPQSKFKPDASLALAEILYDQQKFKDSLNYFKILEDFPQHKIYSYAMYKMAWSYYNLKNTESGVEKLKTVLKINPPNQGEIKKTYNLRREALRDLVIFIGEVTSPEKLYTFFEKLCNEEELGQVMLDLAKLYDSHSRFKEIPIFIQEFNNKNPNHAMVVQTHLVLINSYEVLKQREKVLETLKVGSELCLKNSKWAISQTAENYTDSCQKKFKQDSLEISKKWWEIWLKNKSHAEFSSLTERALRFILLTDDENAPDLKTRYALAELLFQTEQYSEASDEYNKVAIQIEKDITKKKSTDEVLWHDSAYAALYSQEKNIEHRKKKNEETKLFEGKRKSLVQYYLKNFPKGENILPIKMKWAVILYEENFNDQSLEVLEQLINQNINLSIKTKAEDLTLDILNTKKDFATLRTKAEKYKASTRDSERKLSLDKISEQAHYSEAQIQATSKDKSKGIQALLDFSQTHPKSTLAVEAQWQALSLSLTQNKLIETLKLCDEFSNKYSSDPRATDALKESIRINIELGHHADAAQKLKEMAEHKKTSAEKYLLLEQAASLFYSDGDKKSARKIWADLMNETNHPQAPTSVKSADNQKHLIGPEKYRQYLLDSFSEKEKNEQEYAHILQDLVKKNIEPWATDSLVKQAENLLLQNKKTEAFELSKKIMNREVSTERKAPARLVQALILEEEYRQQSIKSSSGERLALVIAMKSEKMEKALSSYLSVMKMSSDAEIQTKSMIGLDRIYGNFITQISDLKKPDNLSDSDFAALQKEISQLTEAIKIKKIDNLKELQSQIHLTNDKLSENKWSLLKGSDTPSPTIPNPSMANLPPLIPSNSNEKEVLQKKYYESEISEPQNSKWGYFHLSISAEKNSLNEKALWAIDKALEKNKDNIDEKNNIENSRDYLTYQKIRLLFSKYKWNLPDTELKNLLNLKISSTQLETFKSFQYFRLSQFEKVVQILSTIPKESLYNINGEFVLAESLCQLKKYDEALSLIKNSPNQLDRTLFQARIYEKFKLDKNSADKSYQEALKFSKNEEQKKWIERKIEYIKQNGQVGS